MKVQVFYISTFKLITVLFFSITVVSCTSNLTKLSPPSQLGDQILIALHNSNKAENSDIKRDMEQFLNESGQQKFTEIQVAQITEMYKSGLLLSISEKESDVLMNLQSDKGESVKDKLGILLLLFPNRASLITETTKRLNLLSEAETIELVVKANLDPTVVMSPSASDAEQEVTHLGWGGGGAFSSVVEFNNEVYASSDVTGVWKFNGIGWDPLVKGLTNYNITGLLVHNGTLLAATKNQILELSNENTWSSTGLKLKTYRHTTLQLFTTLGNGTTCFAALEPFLGCIDNTGSVSKTSLSISKLSGIYRDEYNDNYVFGYYGKKLYRINKTDGTHSLEYSFPKNILRISKLDRDSRPLIFTQKNVYELGSFVPVNVNLNNKSIVNVLTDTATYSNHLIALGNTWSANLYHLKLKDQSLTIGTKVPVKYDTSLPHRQRGQTITKPLGTPHSVWGKLWFSDFWGIYTYDVNTEKIYEKSRNASNIVGTDLHITGGKLYITSMDNGLVSMRLNTPNNFKTVFPRKASDWQLAGHSWSVDSNEHSVFATLSPWNLPQDYLISANKENNLLNIQKIDSSTSRVSSSAFWGQSYSRKLVMAEGVLVYKDGAIGGLYKLSESTNGSNGEVIDNTSEKLFSTEGNRVYRAITTYGGELVTYHIDDEEKLYFNDIATGEFLRAVKAPTGLWAFSLENIEGTLYLLGSRNGAVIYKYNESANSFSEILKVPTASAFLSLKESPDKTIYIAGAIDWSGKPEGKVLFKTENNDSWFDMTCLMPNESGVVDIEFSEDGNFVYLLQHVGAAVKVALSTLDRHKGC